MARMLTATDSRLVPLVDEVRRLPEIVVANHATSAALEGSAGKGQMFEDLIAQVVVDLAYASGELAQRWDA